MLTSSKCCRTGFEHMWGPPTASGLGSQSALGLAPSQPGTTPASRLAEDAALLDFPDWDGPGNSPHVGCGSTAPHLHDLIKHHRANLL